MENSIKIFIALTILFTVFGILWQHHQRKSIKGKVIAYTIRKSNSQLVLGGISLILSLILFTIFLYHVKETYSLLHSKYINSIYDLFSHEVMIGLQKHAYEKQLLSELLTIVEFRGSALNTLIISIATWCSGVLALYKGLQQGAICQEEIHTHRGSQNWSNVTDYKWGQYHTGITIEGYRKYYPLDIFVKNSRIEAFLSCDDISEIRLLINAIDKEVVDDLLKEVIGSE